MNKKESLMRSRKTSKLSNIAKLQSFKIKYGDVGVQFIKDSYLKHNGKELYDFIYPNLFYIPDTSKELNSRLNQVFEHGNSVEQINKSVKAGIVGLHIYKLENGKVLGIVIRQPTSSNSKRKSTRMNKKSKKKKSSKKRKSSKKKKSRSFLF